MLQYEDNVLYIEGVSALSIAEEYLTPCFVYSKAALTQAWNDFNQAFANTGIPYKIFYAVKANSNLAILKLLAKLGAGFDCVSGGEIARALEVGGRARDIVFSGVGKSSRELSQALKLGIYSINVESAAELDRLAALAKEQKVTARIALRLNPDIAADTHSYIGTGKKQDKFGVSLDEATTLIAKIQTLPQIKLAGVSCHIGSQITTVQPFLAALERVLGFIDANNLSLEFINIGGGLGVVYKDEHPPTPQEYANAIAQKLKNRKLTLNLEPGRALVANAGILLTRVEYLKHNFAIVDAAMNDLIRPALYQSYHDIIPVQKRDLPLHTYNVVGPICESGDFLGKDRQLAIQPGDLLAVKSCGAYCTVASSNYNTRPRAAEIMVDGKHTTLIRQRETLEQLWANELCGV